MIDPEEVKAIFIDCLADDPIIGKAVNGVMNSFLFHQNKLDEHKDRITEILLCLPNNFLRSGGGGWSFLQACSDKNGDLWTGFHVRVEQLLVLGIGIDMVEFQLPREMWNILPGGMPYLVVKD